MNFYKLIKSDYKRYIATGAKNKLKIFLNQGFIFTSLFRFNTFLYRKSRRIPFFNFLISIYCFLCLKISQIFTGLSLPIGLEIGMGLFISHSGSIIINSQCKLGNNINLAPGVVIGFGIKNRTPGYPSIGNNVFIGPGAKIFGPIKIGNNVMIGANSVVLSDVSDNSVVAGVPAKIISKKGSAEYIKV